MIIYVWGTGRLVGHVVGKHISINEIEAFIDNDRNKQEYMGKKVILPEQIVDQKYDAILVANLFREEIYKQCLKLGIDIKKVIFLYDNCIMEDVNKDYSFVEKILGKEYACIVEDRYHMVRGVEVYNKPFSVKEARLNKSDGYWRTDYVRAECFELVVKEIYKRNLVGAVAEVGVFRGEFASLINAAFPEKKCYLFDTFDGFDANEALQEIKAGNCTNALVEAYKQTNVTIALERMKYIENIIIKQGYFPQSLEGLEETFAFVSIDVDFEESIYESLKYFYPRLERGGYIFIHDYNSTLLGVEKAVDKYEQEEQLILCKMPLCDANGTLVVMKG